MIKRTEPTAEEMNEKLKTSVEKFKGFVKKNFQGVHHVVNSHTKLTNCKFLVRLLLAFNFNREGADENVYA
jgi:SPX domain protein involved in polyphosphate accumulation